MLLRYEKEIAYLLIRTIASSLELIQDLLTNTYSRLVIGNWSWYSVFHHSHECTSIYVSIYMYISSQECGNSEPIASHFGLFSSLLSCSPYTLYTVQFQFIGQCPEWLAVSTPLYLSIYLAMYLYSISLSIIYNNNLFVSTHWKFQDPVHNFRTSSDISVYSL